MSAFNWLGETVVHSPELLEAAETHVRTTLMELERSAYPLGLSLQEGRVRELTDVAHAVGTFAMRELGVEVPQLPAPDSDHIRFYGAADFAKLNPNVNMAKMCNAFNTPCAYFIGVRERSGPNGTMDTLTSSQHEIIHHGGKRTYSLTTNLETGHIDVSRVSSGLANFAERGFYLLDEALVVALNRDTRHTTWGEYNTLHTYAEKMDEDERDVLERGCLTKPLYFGMLFDYICEKASERTGKNIREELYAAHYSGNQDVVTSLREAFGNNVIENLASMTVDTTREAILNKVAHKIGREGEFCRFVKSKSARYLTTRS